MTTKVAWLALVGASVEPGCTTGRSARRGGLPASDRDNLPGRDTQSLPSVRSPLLTLPHAVPAAERFHLFGVNFVVERGLRIKASGALWDFTDFDDEVAVHAGITANF